MTAISTIDQHGDRSLRLKQLLHKQGGTFLMEAHDGLSARIVEHAGFDGIWASGLSIATSLGVRDNNELSWTQVLDAVEYMLDVAKIPILLDGDTGYGNFNNARRLVAKLSAIGVAGVCIEDKLFPKLNSFIGHNQPLADIDEFCGKIKACKDSQRNANFSVIARVEALIAGHGMAEALRRAEAYHKAGADGILIHSKRSTAAEIIEFLEEWDRRLPTIVVPTTYFETPAQDLYRAGASVVIWANHNMRAAMTAMLTVCRKIRESGSIVEAEGTVIGLKDLFTLLDYGELESAERKYLPAK